MHILATANKIKTELGNIDVGNKEKVEKLEGQVAELFHGVRNCRLTLEEDWALGELKRRMTMISKKNKEIEAEYTRELAAREAASVQLASLASFGLAAQRIFQSGNMIILT